MQNRVISDVYEGKRHKKGEKKGREETKKERRDSPNSGGSALSHFEGGFSKVLREWIPGFGGIKEGR